MGAAKKRLKSAVTIRPKRNKGTLRADVAGCVITHLGGRGGDKLVFEEGCEGAVTRAALRGPYAVVSLERAPQPDAAVEESAETAAAPALEPFAEAVRKRLGGARR